MANPVGYVETSTISNESHKFSNPVSDLLSVLPYESKYAVVNYDYHRLLAHSLHILVIIEPYQRKGI